MKPQHWAKAIKAVGNLCIPQQVYPILCGIQAIWGEP